GSSRDESRGSRPRTRRPAARSVRSNRNSPCALLEKGKEDLDLCERLQLIASLHERLRSIVRRPEEEAIGPLQLEPCLFRETSALQAYAVQAIKLHRAPRRLYVGRDILRYPGRAAHKGVGSDPNELMDRGQSADDGPIADRH